MYIISVCMGSIDDIFQEIINAMQKKEDTPKSKKLHIDLLSKGK